MRNYTLHEQSLQLSAVLIKKIEFSSCAKTIKINCWNRLGRYYICFICFYFEEKHRERRQTEQNIVNHKSVICRHANNIKSVSIWSAVK